MRHGGGEYEILPMIWKRPQSQVFITHLRIITRPSRG